MDIGKEQKLVEYEPIEVVIPKTLMESPPVQNEEEELVESGIRQ